MAAARNSTVAIHLLTESHPVQGAFQRWKGGNMRRFAVTLLSALLAMPALSQQQPAFGERVDVNAVLIDAIVTDSKGNQILGLTEQDFVVTEDGKAQPLDSVDYYTTRRLLNVSEERAPFKVERIREQRYFVIFFDKPFGTDLFDKLAQARQAAERFVDREVGANDYVAVTGHDVRLKVYSDFTNDKTRLKRAIRDAAVFSKGLTRSDKSATGPSIMREIDSAAMMGGTGTVYEGITELARALRPIRGRKDLILFSAGIVEPGEEVRDGFILNRSRFYQPMLDALNDANVTVYAANLLLAEAEPVFHQTLEMMSRDTGGEYRRHNVSFNPIFEQVSKAASGYYMLSYRTNKPAGTKGFQKVEVSVKDHPEFRVKARSGYYFGG
jgi:VWFA-related protein